MSTNPSSTSSASGLRIAWAHMQDAQALVPLFLELYAHTNPHSEKITKPQALDHIRHLMAPKIPHRLAIAWDDDGTPTGLAAAAIFMSVAEWRADYRVQMELKEFFVAAAHRSQGIGESLMIWLEDYARSQGVKRFDWHVQADNRRGQMFYQKAGATIVKDRLSMRKLL